MRGSFNTFKDRVSQHVVSAYANESGMVVGQVATDEKSNEITAIPRLLKLLDLNGCLVTIDAMGYPFKAQWVFIRRKRPQFAQRVTSFPYSH
jgi:hypothetical protein